MRNLEAELERKRKGTDEFVGSLESEAARKIAAGSGTIRGRREGFYSSALTPELQRSGFNGREVATALNMGRRGLDRNLMGKESERKIQANKDKADLTFQAAFRRATEADMNYADAVAYARQVALDESRRSAEKSEFEANAASARRKQDTADRYAQLGLTDSPGTDYQSAMLRALFGLGGAAATGYALSKPREQQPVNNRPLTYGQTMNFNPNTLRSQSGYSY